MAINSSIVSTDFLSHAARALGVDWIRVRDDRLFRAPPDVVKEDSAKRVQNFWCPEVMWSVDGKAYAVAVPIKTKLRKWKAERFLGVEILPAGWEHQLDDHAMLEALGEAIQSTITK